MKRLTTKCDFCGKIWYPNDHPKDEIVIRSFYYYGMIWDELDFCNADCLNSFVKKVKKTINRK
jgi:hypothetical protein